ncbi:fructosamine kinase PKL/CAK/FruK [Pleurotus eryngii]|uniref:protein-ribulosamine 3-kinase n=1 Tax=Pleurotus eryngii TaxID=5323 RepID=A0A9P6DKT3_PLEER|nr:fructosamine kinase PKL/CAK/FruK [Pleurotus eryngii]
MPGQRLPKVVLDELESIDPKAEFSGSMPRIESSSGSQYFIKVGSPGEAEQYEGEAESLKAMDAASPGLAPRVLASGKESTTGRPHFISQYKDLTHLTDSASRKLGQRLAQELHAYKSSSGFGFGVPTYCGATRLENGWFETWEACYSAMVGDLARQLRKKGKYAGLCEAVEEVRERVIPRLLGSISVPPVLLHGDLWSGNTGTDRSTGEPVIFDPASFYGHNEADLAIGRMFGGIPGGFYEEYHKYLPKTEPVGQYGLRSELYQLFHYLNHTLLFGGSYQSSAMSKTRLLLSAKR